MEKNISKIVEELLKKLQISATVIVEKDAEEIYHVNIATEESGLLIGWHGETLSAIQLILGIIIHQNSKEWVQIVVDVGDYRAKRNESLAAMAISAADQAMENNVPVALPPMSPIERRAVHMALSERVDVETYSEGEDRFRHVVVRPRA